ncbi:hypothetical protein NPIL_200841 [Nephila pilipes]|uniref:Uncharacterized protein n=1 Tax=Nephila pilipes TaxID=299642 RepID=A0A8X6TGS2_NEPPI|nr:hypothetical protein NPIL_200841 [Nephila pilipes]
MLPIRLLKLQHQNKLQTHQLGQSLSKNNIGKLPENIDSNIRLLSIQRGPEVFQHINTDFEELTESRMVQSESDMDSIAPKVLSSLLACGFGGGEFSDLLRHNETLLCFLFYIYTSKGSSDSCSRQEFEEGSRHMLVLKRRRSTHDMNSLQRSFDNAEKLTEIDKSLSTRTAAGTLPTIILGIEDDECDLDEAPPDTDKEEFKFEHVRTFTGFQNNNRLFEFHWLKPRGILFWRKGIFWAFILLNEKGIGESCEYAVGTVFVIEIPQDIDVNQKLHS